MNDPRPFVVAVAAIVTDPDAEQKLKAHRRAVTEAVNRVREVGGLPPLPAPEESS